MVGSSSSKWLKIGGKSAFGKKVWFHGPGITKGPCYGYVVRNNGKDYSTSLYGLGM